MRELDVSYGALDVSYGAKDECPGNVPHTSPGPSLFTALVWRSPAVARSLTAAWRLPGLTPLSIWRHHAAVQRSIDSGRIPVRGARFLSVCWLDWAELRFPRPS